MSEVSFIMAGISTSHQVHVTAGIRKHEAGLTVMCLAGRGLLSWREKRTQ